MEKKWEANRRSDDEMCIDHREFLTLHRQQLMMISSGNSAERDVPPFPRLFSNHFCFLFQLKCCALCWVHVSAAFLDIMF